MISRRQLYKHHRCEKTSLVNGVSKAVVDKNTPSCIWRRACNQQRSLIANTQATLDVFAAISTTVDVIKKVGFTLRKVARETGMNMNRRMQVSMAKKHLHKQNIQPDTVDVESLVDGSLSFGENWDNIKRFVGISSQSHKNRMMEDFRADIANAGSV